MKYYRLSVEPYGVPIQIVGELPSSTYPTFLDKGHVKRMQYWNEIGTELLSKDDLIDDDKRRAMVEWLDDEASKIIKAITSDTEDIKIVYSAFI